MFWKKRKVEIDSVTYKDLKVELANALAEIERLKLDVDRLNRQLDDYEKVDRKLADSKKELAKVKKMVRDQTEADILVNAFKAVGIIKEPEIKPINHYLEQARAMNARLRELSATNGLGLGGLNALAGNAYPFP